MKEGPDISSLAALIGDPARANILCALMAGKALTAGELAKEAGVMPQTASSHLAKLVGASLLFVEVQGRHRYYRIAGPDVAEAIETMMGLAARIGHLRARTGPKDPAMRLARLCYDHLAGEMGAALYDALFDQGLIVVERAGLVVSPKGRTRFIAEGIDMAELEARRCAMCRTCLDWSERRHHLAGSLGTALASLVTARGWARRETNSRIVSFTPQGMTAFHMFMQAGRMVNAV